ncbi:MAG TPA: cytochrome c3 family protein [Acidobacteriota bacterium]|jgi:predicted CXXCH cytochrome family protein
MFNTRFSRPRILAIMISVAGVLCLTLAQKQPAAKEPASVTWKAPLQGKADDYVGLEVCASCHPDQAQQFAKTVHARAEVAGVKFGAGCESCHGPGKAHTEAIGEAGNDPVKTEQAKKLIFAFHGKPAQNADQCLRCHGTSKDQDFFKRSEHKLNGVSCEQCHAPHLVVSKSAAQPERKERSISQAQFFLAPRLPEEQRWLRESLLRKPQVELCGSCHRTIQAQFALPTHHRVPEGLMKCTDCHNAHGSPNRPQLRKTNWEVCVSCHVEKRGPFVFEHAAVKVEGCVACHSPHGTVTRHMLLRREGRFLCLQCHVDPFAANVPHGRLGFPTRGECVRCHAVIHGSNSSQFFLQ